MDYLHSCYTAPARLIEGSDETFTIRWYRAQPGAKVYDQPHAFAASVWDDTTTLGKREGVGEFRGHHVWSPNRLSPFSGQCSPANPDWLLTGLPQSVYDSGPPATLCCCTLAACDHGAVAFDGSEKPPMFSGAKIHGGSGQVVPDSALVTLTLMTTVDYDLSGYVSGAGFVAPADGHYHVTVAVLWDPPVAETMYEVIIAGPGAITYTQSLQIDAIVGIAFTVAVDGEYEMTAGQSVLVQVVAVGDGSDQHVISAVAAIHQIH